MFSPGEINAALLDPQITHDLAQIRAVLSNNRLRREVVLDPDSLPRLERVVDSVLVSAPDWNEEAAELVLRAAEVSETLAIAAGTEGGARLRLRAALLYELGAMPMMAAAVIRDGDGPTFLIDFLKRRQAFKSLAEEIRVNGDVAEAKADVLLRLGSCEAALELADFEHDSSQAFGAHTAALEEVARNFEVDMSLSEVKAFAEVVSRRASRSTRLHAPDALFAGLRAIGFPPELWAAQTEAIGKGLLDLDHDSWGLAAPTGAGKTFLARLLILDALQQEPGSKVLYIVPTKALVHQVSRDLGEAFEPLDLQVTSVTPQLAALDDGEEAEISESSVLVLTPEKADLLLRIGAEFLKEASLVVVDEAHHIEDGTRGVLLELYLARLRTALAGSARYVLLSAVAPNIADITKWMGKKPGSALIDQRATRMKVGVYRVRREGRFNRGVIDYTDGNQLRVFEKGVQKGKRAGLIQLAAELSKAGPILVVAKGQGTAEKVAEGLRDQLQADGLKPLSREQRSSSVMERLDSRLEREMYADVGLRKLIRWGVAYHHAGLPPRVREALEEAVSKNYIRSVVATTTLADGVNFPFSTVVVESLAIQNPSFEAGKPMDWRVFTPRRFWNIAGRAGRPGYDHEGHVILFEPSLGLDRVNQAIEPYITPHLLDMPPVTSALAEGLREMEAQLKDGDFSLESLEETELPEGLPKETKGVVNLLRVGLAHAKATEQSVEPDEYFSQTYASRILPESERAFGLRLMRQQQKVLDSYLADTAAPTIDLVAELGLSIDTLSRLQRYVRELGDWQFEALVNVLFGPQINFKQLPYILIGVLQNMAELEGRKLSGWYSETVVDWCSGKPFSTIARQKNERSLEDLISLMYSRIQYTLPWGLYATDRFVAEVAHEREIQYDSQLNKLAYLVEAGVPDRAALRLTALGFERTDAARLSRTYFGSREARETTDIISWLCAQSDEALKSIVVGADRRRVDFDFIPLLKEVREGKVEERD
jgi:superfamily II DNA/RNA helicase